MKEIGSTMQKSIKSDIDDYLESLRDSITSVREWGE